MTTEEGLRMINDLADFRVPVLLFSGGEPIMRKDLLMLNQRAKQRGMHTTISTNGTLITKSTARRLFEAGFDYCGISLDGLEDTHDRFRARRGAFRATLHGIRNLMSVGQKVGLRYTITRQNLSDLKGIFKLVEEEGIPRICFYHLVPSGRGQLLKDIELSHGQTRLCIEAICEWALSLHKKNDDREVLTVDNHTDGVFIYLMLKKRSIEQARKALSLLQSNGGNGSGMTIACIDDKGNVYPDQFWRTHILGNIRQRPFNQIWTDVSNDFLARLKNRKAFLKGKCSRCAFLDICNGNFRARAEYRYGDPWMEDPACYLTEEEITDDAVS